MKVIQSSKTAIQFLMARLYTQLPTRANRQRGASALEYLVLAAVVVLVIGAAAYLVFGDSGSGAINDAFTKISDCVADGAEC